MTICRVLVDLYVFLSTILSVTDFNCRAHKIDNGKQETGKTAYYKNLQTCGQNRTKKPTKTDKKLRVLSTIPETRAGATKAI